MDRPVAAYRGTEAYAFVCYAHRNAAAVYADLTLLSRHGVRVWYDEGIAAGTSWRGEIAEAIKGADRFIFYISSASLASAHCRREVDYAVNHDIPVIPIYLENAQLPGELDLVLNRVHALFRDQDSRYETHLLDAVTQDAGQAAPLHAVATSGKPRLRSLVLPVAVLLAVAGGLLTAVLNPGAPPEAEPAATAQARGPDAFDLYLSGQQLIENWDQGDNLEAGIQALRKATELDPEFALAHARLANALRMRYALTRNTAFLEQAAEHANEAMRLNDSLAPVRIAYGRVRAAEGHMDLALEALQEAIAIDPNEATAHQAIATVYERLGRVADAENAFRQAVSLAPENTKVLDSRANFLYRQGRYSEAAGDWRKVLRLAPGSFAALVNLGSALSQVGRISESIEAYERALALRPTYMAYSNLGTAYSRAKRYPEAAEAYRAALAIDDTDWLAWGNLGFVYSWMNASDTRAGRSFDRAIEIAEAARATNGRDAYLHSDLALYYAKTGENELALERVATALALASDSAEIVAAAAETHELLAQREKSVELAARALELGYSRELLARSPEMIALLDDPRMNAQQR